MFVEIFLDNFGFLLLGFVVMVDELIFWELYFCFIVSVSFFVLFVLFVNVEVWIDIFKVLFV